jgi:glycosyltransferase involved in cell wall biosynthesis
MKILFVGATWKGSSDRSLREALVNIPGLWIDDIGEDHYATKGGSVVVRISNRLLRRWYQAELATEILQRIYTLNPDALVVYKGGLVTAETIRQVQTCGICTVNIFPDCSPHAYGQQLKEVMGTYDLVVSTKPFHPQNWAKIYGYSNPCVFVPHGYDPQVHFWLEPPKEQDIDLVCAASWRPQYERLMVEMAGLLQDVHLSVALAGNGWAERRYLFPSHWQFPGGLYGRAYGEFLRRGKIAIAPVHTEVVIDGARQPGDEDTTRTYELAAAGCFFLHRRTPYVQQIYDEATEVPMWASAQEMVALIRQYLPCETDRRAMAAAAHRRAVPAYSIPARAESVAAHIRGFVLRRKQDDRV